MKLNHLKIGTRLTIGFSLLLMLTLFTATVGWLGLASLHRDFNRVVTSTIPSMVSLEQMRGHVEQMRLYQVKFSTDRLPISRKMTATLFDERRPKLKALYEQYGETLKAHQEDTAIWESLGTKIAEYDKVSRAVEAHVAEINDQVSTQLNTMIFVDALNAYNATIVEFDKLKTLNVEIAKQSEGEGKATYRKAQSVIAIVTGLSLALGAILAWLLTRSIVGPVLKAVDAMRRIADGELALKVDSSGRDELSQMLGTLEAMQKNLSRVVGDIRDSSGSVAQAVAEISAGNDDLSRRTELQSANLGETAGSVQQLTANLKQSEEQARQADKLSNDASRCAGQGAEVVSRVINTMQHIQESSDRISDIVSVIDGIAFQTNILALNAAVEAARAGEQGRGFSVVAAEVRALAQRCALAAKEIKTLIAESADSVQSGSRLVGDAGKSMEDVRTHVVKVATLIRDVRSTASSQSASIEEINQAIGQLDRATQQNAALVEQASAAAESLKQQSKMLVNSVSVFQTEPRALVNAC
jgi:methyl-accepting chemotaxis protein